MNRKYGKKFEKIFNTTRYISKMCGADVIDKDYRMTVITWFVFSLINLAILFAFYSFYNAIYEQHDFTELLKCLSTFGTGVQGYTKLITAVTQKEYFRFFYKEILNLYTTFANDGENYDHHLKESLSLVKKLINILWAITAMAAIIIIGIPIFYLLIFNRRIFIMPLYLPLIDRYSDFGYFLTSSIHVTCVIFGVFGNMASDCWCFVFAAHIPLIKNILKNKFNNLNQILEKSPKEIKKSKPLLLDIFRWHQKYILYCKNIKILFFWVIFVQVATEFSSIVCTIVCIFMGVWPAAPAYLIYSFVMFYIFCALGNIIEIANDEVITIIYDSNWYHLTVMEQKMIIIMLREAQQAEGMSVGGVAPLSLNTALHLTKTFYTLSMMLRNFLN